MKKDDFLDVFGDIDEKYIKDAEGYKPGSKKRLVKITALAACLCLVISLGTYLLLPLGAPASLKQYQGSEYFDVISALEYADNDISIYPNRLTMIVDMLFSKTSPGVNGGLPIFAGSVVPEDGANGNQNYGGSYIDVTDNQVEGVIEGDLFKRNENHIFYLTKKYDNVSEGWINTLKVYTIEGEESALASQYTLAAPADAAYGTTIYCMYLADDGKTLIYLCGYYDGEESRTKVQYLDVSQPEQIKEVKSVSVSGRHKASRLIDDKLMLVTEHIVDDADYDAPKTFVPSVDTGNGASLLSPDSILVPSEVYNKNFTVISVIDGGGELLSSEALMSYSGIIYSTAEAIYAVRNYTKVDTDRYVYLGEYMSDITRFEYKDGALVRGKTYTLRGDVLNQYSLDERDGVLRIVTTTKKMAMKHTNSGFSTVEYDGYNNGSNASLYCVDIASGKVIASVEDFAPYGEEVTSARFNGDMLYVCTAKKIVYTDPVFFFDLSDLENITYKDTGYIAGFSSSLVDYGEGNLLGVGRLDRNQFKLELYKESADGIESVDTYLLDGSVSDDYKCYLIDRESDLFGFMASVYSSKLNQYSYYYKLVGIRDGALVELMEIRWKITRGDMNINTSRAAIIDGYLYVMSNEKFAVKPVK